jgi:hypothetical protein
MSRRNVYLLEHTKRKRLTIVGVFSSREKAEAVLRRLPKTYPFLLYKLRMNATLTKGRTLEDQQGVYRHWHYGTDEVVTVTTDDEGNVISQTRGKKYMWRFG